ncbi:MAG TPA: ribulokinase [Gaiellaceae bacterium]|nr:ribulokinase [Gaiellaceae bacterium]
MTTYAVGVDFGTESGRAVLVDCADGRELATSVYPYRNGVIAERLPAPDEDVRLEPEWALQDPEDYIRTFQTTVPALLAETGVEPAGVIGIGIDFTSCTMLPTLADGTPLCMVEDLRREPHAWVKLWKHHAAQPEADRINEVAADRNEPWLLRYGGRYSSEWFFSKALQILDEAPEIYERADRLIEAADWVVWQLTGIETRNSCTAGYKALWSKSDGFPADEYFAALDPRFAHVVDEKMSRRLAPLGARAGGLGEQAAGWTGLLPGTAVAVANVDAHVSAPAVTVTEPGTLVAIMGTSICHIALGAELAAVDGMCGVVEDGVVPGLFGYEAGQSAVGDIFAWFVEEAVPPRYHELARERGVDVHELLEAEAAELEPGESGLLALDWWNGNRSVLVDADLRGLLVGMTLATRAPEIYRALIEATAFGTRVIADAFERGGVPVDRIVACGGLPERNTLLMQIYADVTGRSIFVAGSKQAPALGAAMFGAVAAGAALGGYDSIVDASRRMGRLSETTYEPNPAHQATYDTLYQEYLRLHDLFGRHGDDVMRNLKRIQREAIDRIPAER